MILCPQTGIWNAYGFRLETGHTRVWVREAATC